MKKFNPGVDYEYVVSEDDKNSVHIKLLTGDYKDTLFKYGKVGIQEENEVAYLQFEYNVIESPIKKLEKNEDFKNYLGDLLTSIMIGNLGLEDEGYYDENRTDDFEESDLR
jgi:hypothetical protein